MFDTLGFLWIHHGTPQYMIYPLDKLVAWLDGERKNHVKSEQLSPLYSEYVSYYGEASGAGCCSRKSIADCYINRKMLS